MQDNGVIAQFALHTGYAIVQHTSTTCSGNENVENMTIIAQFTGTANKNVTTIRRSLECIFPPSDFELFPVALNAQKIGVT